MPFPRKVRCPVDTSVTLLTSSGTLALDLITGCLCFARAHFVRSSMLRFLEEVPFWTKHCLSHRLRLVFYGFGLSLVSVLLRAW